MISTSFHLPRRTAFRRYYMDTPTRMFRIAEPNNKIVKNLVCQQHKDSFGYFSSNAVEKSKHNKPPQNQALLSVKEQGLKVLQSLTTDIQSKTKHRLLIIDEDKGPTPEQLREARRLKLFVEDAIEQYTSRKGGLFCVMNEPIPIIAVEITEDLRQARVFWSLPYGVLLMDLDPGVRAKATQKMQQILEEKGGVLQGLVHSKMRGYFRPPKIRFVPAEGEMLRYFLKELL